ncbi:diphosphate--fructose-6-phosphate 1-phosphotransferase [bacterium]|nr:diphosphate--fructose-6-phosphate 1-phosphotransferase [bacterium]
MTKSSFTQNRAKYQPKLPSLLKKAGLQIEAKPVVKTTKSVANSAEIKKLFPHIYGKPTLTFAKAKKASKKAFNVGVVLSGGQAPGGHNVVSGILDGIKASSPKSNLIGFLGGPSGLIENKFVNLTPAFVKDYRNTGGFDIIGSGRTKLETEEQFASARSTMQAHKLDALVIVGGDDSNTNACMLAEYIAAKGSPISVIGVPKTIDGDLKNSEIGASFGFDTASKVYSELVGNICRDANSAKKYWHFIKLMGRSASHITLEVALQTQPNLTFISEEIAEKKMTLDQVVKTITDAIVRRSEMKKNFGVIVIPEGLIEFIPEVKKLIAELNDLLAGKDDFATLGMDDKLQFVNKNISAASAKVFSSLPMLIKSQLLMDRDPHGNVQVSRIETDKLLIDLVGDALRELKQAGKYKGKFSALSHFFGYEGRCASPSNFDADYCYGLGFNAAALVSVGANGYMSTLKNLAAPAEKWVPGGVPLTMMMNMEHRHGKDKPVIKKALVDLKGKPFKTLAANRAEWTVTESYQDPGAIQYWGPSAVCDATTKTLALEQKK